jgi:iron complex outermembrane receptor protein
MLALKSITSYRELTNDFAATSDGSPVGGIGFNELFGHSFQQEARLTGTVGSLVDFTVGAFYFTQKNTNNNRIDIESIPPGLDFISNEVADSTSWALFAHTVWHLTDRLNLTAGLRYSDERKNQLLGRLDPATGGQTASTSPFFAELFANGGYAPNVIWKGSRVDYRAGLDYQLTDSLMVYASTSTGYKSGGVSPRFYFVSHILPYNEEQVTAYEAGFKTDLFERKVRVNGAVFLSDYNDQQVPAPGSVCPGLTPPAPCIADFNLVDSRYWGAELEVNIQPAADTLIDLSGSYIAAKYTNGTGAIEKAADPNFVDHPDAPPFIPQWKFSAGAQHSFEVGGRGSITPRVDMNYEAARKSNVITGMATPARTLANASLTWRSEDDSWEARFEVSNLFDKYYYVSVFDTRSAFGSAGALPGEPREWKLTIRRSF